MCGFLVDIGSPGGHGFEAALDTLRSRGPDAQGIWRSPDITMGHRRLAVIDLAGGTQPMPSPDGRFHLVYNGELYNYRDIRHELATHHGITFHTRSDTEVMLHALITWGEAALKRFNGIFALALWDSRERTLLAARDRLGVKPAYVHHDGGRFVVASTMGPMWSLPGLKLRGDLHALRDYLCQDFFTAPATITANVQAMEPGEWVRFHVDGGRVERGFFWTIPPMTGRPMKLADLIAATDEAMRRAVERQLVSDVPLGVLFSGGIDSSLITHYAMQALGGPVKTFTVKFDQSAGHDEAPIAAAVAKQMGTEHREYRAGQITQEDFAAAVAGMDLPFGDSSLLPVMKVCQLARQFVTVVLGGDGGDELFGGYPRYLKDESTYPDGAGHRMIRRMVERGMLPTSLYRAAQRGQSRIWGRRADRSLRSLIPARRRRWRWTRRSKHGGSACCHGAGRWTATASCGRTCGTTSRRTACSRRIGRRWRMGWRRGCRCSTTRWSISWCRSRRS
jgi:asparagine synthase (glutamine-hydrolysing)